MSTLLSQLLTAGLIDNLDGRDDRFEKLERAALALATKFQAQPSLLIGGLLAGLDPDIEVADPLITLASESLAAEWKTAKTVYPSPPVHLYRAILLEACHQSAEGKNAGILWLTAANTLPMMHLGREEMAVRQAVTVFAEKAEKLALLSPPLPMAGKVTPLGVAAPATVLTSEPRKVDRAAFVLKVAGSVFSSYRNGAKLQNPNTVHPSQDPQNWSWHFADRMAALLADEFDALAANFTDLQQQFAQQLQSTSESLTQGLTEVLTQQQEWVQQTIEASAIRQRAEQVRLNSLWWAEALYSPSLKLSYRELEPTLAAIAMAADLLKAVQVPTPASVAYLLTETVNKLPGAGFVEKRSLKEHLEHLRSQRSNLPRGWLDALSLPPTEGRLSLRDLVVLALGDREWTSEALLKRAGLKPEVSMSLPTLAQAMFRQEQALQLAGGRR